MKNIKTIFTTTFIVVFAFTSVVFNACKKKDISYNDTTLIRPCDGVICLNGAACLDGLCICPKGYEGNKCQLKWSDKFAGVYIATDDCNTGVNPVYEVDITPNIEFPYKINLFNLGVICTNKIIVAEINPEKTSFIIPVQNTCNNLYLNGYGNINGEFINIYLTSRDTVMHIGKQCSIILAKKP